MHVRANSYGLYHTADVVFLRLTDNRYYSFHNIDIT